MNFLDVISLCKCVYISDIFGTRKCELKLQCADIYYLKNDSISNPFRFTKKFCLLYYKSLRYKLQYLFLMCITKFQQMEVTQKLFYFRMTKFSHFKMELRKQLIYRRIIV